MIEVMQASKAFAGVEAVRDLTCRIRDGEVFGLVGTNGAGTGSRCGKMKPQRAESVLSRTPGIFRSMPRPKV